MIAPTVTIVVPTRSDEPSLMLTLPRILRAAQAIGRPTEVLLAVTVIPGAPLPSFASPAPDMLRLRQVVAARPGKTAALLAATREARGALLVLVDADVVPQEDAFRLLLQPLLEGWADVCAGRPTILARPAPGESPACSSAGAASR